MCDVQSKLETLEVSLTSGMRSEYQKKLEDSTIHPSPVRTPKEMLQSEALLGLGLIVQIKMSPTILDSLTDVHSLTLQANLFCLFSCFVGEEPRIIGETGKSSKLNNLSYDEDSDGYRVIAWEIIRARPLSFMRNLHQSKTHGQHQSLTKKD